MTDIEKYLDYLQQLRTPFTKLCRLRFLQPDGSTAFALDNNYRQDRNANFISEGQLTVNHQNGTRRTASVTLANINEEFDYNVNKIWFGQEIALDEGLILSDGSEYYIPQGIFLIDTPQESVMPNGRMVTYNLVDKWANLDGTLFGYLDGTYQVDVGTNIFDPITALLAEDRGNGLPVDRVTPVYTDYFNNKTQQLPDGTPISMVLSPYTLTIDSENGTIADIVLGLTAMINGYVGYDSTGALRIEPSQDDIEDNIKPVLWQYSQEETTLLGMTYTTKNTEVYNDIIIIGEELSDYAQPYGRAQNFDATSDTNINLIGEKIYREAGAGYSTARQCADYAMWKLKRASILKKSVEISSSQIMHMEENKLVTIVRTDKEGAPMERHLVQGFSRPLASSGEMTISCTSVNDIANMQITRSSYAVIPAMTSNTTPSGVAFSDITWGGSPHIPIYDAFYAMDNNDNNVGFYSYDNSDVIISAYLGYEFENPTTITKAEWIPIGATQPAYVNSGAKTVILQASNDGINYVDLSEQVIASTITSLTTIPVTKNQGEYLYCRLNILNNFYLTFNGVCVNMFQVYGYQ